MAKKVNRKGTVRHITLDPTDIVAQYYAKLGVPAKDLYEAGLTLSHEVIEVEYTQDHEENYVRPKGVDMGEGRYWVGGSPVSAGWGKGMQNALRDGFKDLSR